jgi:glutaredoxin
MFSAEWCGFCRKARRYFKANGVTFRERDIEKDAAARREYERLGGNGLPLILVGDQRLSGFSEDGFRRLYER